MFPLRRKWRPLPSQSITVAAAPSRPTSATSRAGSRPPAAHPTYVPGSNTTDAPAGAPSTAADQLLPGNTSTTAPARHGAIALVSTATASTSQPPLPVHRPPDAAPPHTFRRRRSRGNETWRARGACTASRPGWPFRCFALCRSLHRSLAPRCRSPVTAGISTRYSTPRGHPRMPRC